MWYFWCGIGGYRNKYTFMCKNFNINLNPKHWIFVHWDIYSIKIRKSIDHTKCDALYINKNYFLKEIRKGGERK